MELAMSQVKRVALVEGELPFSPLPNNGPTGGFFQDKQQMEW
jgi:hypothetical protein